MINRNNMKWLVLVTVICVLVAEVSTAGGCWGGCVFENFLAPVRFDSKNVYSNSKGHFFTTKLKTYVMCNLINN